jgi:hypothetical protein
MLAIIWLGRQAMNTYRVERAGKKFQVIEELPDRGTFEVAGFPTENDARAWLDDFLQITARVGRRAPGPMTGVALPLRAHPTASGRHDP